MVFRSSLLAAPLKHDGGGRWKATRISIWATEFILKLNAFHEKGLPEKARGSAFYGNLCAATLDRGVGNLWYSRDAGDALLLCAVQHVSDVEVIPIPQINEAFERVLKSDVKYRFVIDMASLKKS